MKGSRFSIAVAMLVCVALLVTVIPTGVKAALPSEQTFISEGAEESTYALWDQQFTRFDANNADSQDWWCRTMHEVHSGSHSIYCAKNGYNSHYYSNGTQCEDVNITHAQDPSQQSDVLRYDTNQDSIMWKALDTSARYYGTVTVTFWFWSDTGISDAKQPSDSASVGYDFLNLIYYTGTGSTLTKHVAWTDTQAQAMAKTWTQVSIVIPSNSTRVGFEFVSGTTAPQGGDASSPASWVNIVNGGMKEGVFLDDITVIGSDKLPAQALSTAVDPLPDYENSLTFNVSYSTNDPELGMKWIDLFYRVDGTGDWKKYETSLRPDGKFPNSTTAIEFTAPKEGTYEFFTRGTDNLDVMEGAKTVAEASTTIDLSGPTSTIKFSGKGDGSAYEGAVSFSITGTDAVSGIDSIHYRINGGNWMEYSSAVGLAKNGQYKIDYYATDKAGNNESVKSSTITLSKASPGIVFENPVISSNGDVTVNFTVALNGTTVKALQYQLDDGALTNLDPANTSVSFTGLKEGDHTLTIRATDSNGEVLVGETTFSVKSSGFGSWFSDPLVLIGIIAVVIVAVAGVFWFVRRKK
ncbi:MAG: hypothetical protein SA339_04350 [Methanomassiliicoccus sp.]|nr:hypothetical protein [Methanomassiliicoccus sp.]